MNEHLSKLTETSHHFATAACFYYQHKERKLTWSGAGHSPALLFHHNQSVQELNTSGIPLGLLEDGTFDQHTCVLTSGDKVIVYTDGLTEVCLENNSELGTEGLIGILKQHGYPKKQLHFKALEKEILTLSTELILEDDVCIIEMNIKE